MPDQATRENLNEHGVFPNATADDTPAAPAPEYNAPTTSTVSSSALSFLLSKSVGPEACLPHNLSTISEPPDASYDPWNLKPPTLEPFSFAIGPSDTHQTVTSHQVFTYRSPLRHVHFYLTSTSELWNAENETSWHASVPRSASSDHYLQRSQLEFDLTPMSDEMFDPRFANFVDSACHATEEDVVD
ncbi:uncharacterized protein JCM15063_006425 [Sporobolomyces koalae]|uniref:uncharacterized protein n=1 Tax=Sporobolomyces koalae TaxID=500713 RepID=UPI00317E0E48